MKNIRHFCWREVSFNICMVPAQVCGGCNLARDPSLQSNMRVQALLGDSDKAHSQF